MVAFYYIPLLQVFSVWIPNLIMLYFFIKFRPHHKTSLRIIDILIESCFLAIHSLIVVLAAHDMTNFLDFKSKQAIRNFIILCCVIPLFINLGFVVKEEIEVFSELYKTLRKLFKPKVMKNAYLYDRRIIRKKDTQRNMLSKIKSFKKFCVNIVYMN